MRNFTSLGVLMLASFTVLPRLMLVRILFSTGKDHSHTCSHCHFPLYRRIRSSPTLSAAHTMSPLRCKGRAARAVWWAPSFQSLSHHRPSPFQVLRRAYSKEADIWSCGVMLYILLCGFPPFHGDNEKKIFEAVISKPLDFQSDPWPKISGWWGRWTKMGCLVSWDGMFFMRRIKSSSLTFATAMD